MENKPGKTNTNRSKETRNEQRTPGTFFIVVPRPHTPTFCIRVKEEPGDDYCDVKDTVIDTTNDNEFIVHEQNFFL